MFSHVVCCDRCVAVALLDNATRSLLFDTLSGVLVVERDPSAGTLGASLLCHRHASCHSR